MGMDLEAMLKAEPWVVFIAKTLKRKAKGLEFSADFVDNV